MRNINSIPHYKIAVVANMSAGKSTFINALFGDGVLPAYSHATTDCPIYIYSDDDADNDMAIVEFTDGKSSVKLSREVVKEEIKLYAQKDNDVLDEKYKNVKKIELYWDFRALRNKQGQLVDFVVIDTPGPNNTDQHSEKHSSATKDIISKEADLVLFLFDYGQIDANLQATEDNIWGMIKKRKETDPNFETIFVINKIDQAIEDNKKIDEVRSSCSRAEYHEKLRKHWLNYERVASEKIKKSANTNGFKSPKVYLVSSKYAELYENRKNLNMHQKDDLEEFILMFKNTFGSKWRHRFFSYIGVERIESKLIKCISVNLKAHKNLSH